MVSKFKKNKIMRKFNYILLSLIFLVGFSCTKDALKLNLKELDEVTIEGIEKIYNVQFGSNLKIEPTITTTFGSSEDKFDYIWYVYNLSSGSRADTIGRELNLDAQINKAAGVPYKVTLKVVNKVDKNFTLKTVDLTVFAEYSNGIMALTKTNNEFDLTFIKNGTDVVKDNLYSKNNDGEKLPTTSSKLFSIDAVHTRPGIYRKIVITTNDDKIGLYIEPNEFVNIGTVNELFYAPLPSGKNYNLFGTCNSQGNEYMLINNKLYDRAMDRNSDSENPKFNSEILCTVPPKEVELAPHLLQPSGLYGNVIIFDNKNGRFLYYEDNSKYSFFVNSTDGEAFKAFNPGKLAGMKMICAGYYDNSIDKMWTLMDDSNTGNLRILSMSHETVNWAPVFKTLTNKEVTRTIAPKLFQATNVKSASYSYVAGSSPWAYVMKGIGNMFLYIVDNVLYAYNISNDYEGVLVDGNAAGFDIDDVFVHNTFVFDSEGKEDKFVRVGLAIRDKQGSGLKGGVAYYKVNFVGGISATQYFKKTGFCDQVISFDEKIN